MLTNLNDDKDVFDEFLKLLSSWINLLKMLHYENGISSFHNFLLWKNDYKININHE